MDITYLDSQIRKKNRHIPSDYWYAHALTQKVHCVHSIDRQRAIVNVPACSRLGQNSNNVPGKNPVGIFEEKGANNFF